ncbi:DUF547 domain-containing protein [Adhaeretor mobilis]|uniref:DUF547 domain-containing protein n=1 Tax=Adhaeretor mobilis TaxID=1930276 RepID=A0A517N0U1_9BACT|nr:DUF547 domain-containing protein [Adhaeretor mobilis]QDT00750.1 hypothetical protein HG15A2_40900 [Adhaeretor mobilis]
MIRNFFTLTSGVVLLLGCLAPSASAGSKVHVGRKFPESQQVSMDQVDHRIWHQLLQKYVDSDGQVNYQAWKGSAQDTQSLDVYLNSLSQASRKARATRESQLAFWINAYNAVTVKGILREYPTDSIRNHTAKVFGYNIWHDLLLTVGDSTISLDDMEHKVLRTMKEPRIHFAIVCASYSCPRLLNEAYTAENLDAQLAKNTQAFFANPGNFRYDVAKPRFYLSSILSWFGEDFGSNQATQLKTISSYLPTEAAQNAAQKNAVSVSYLDYDWSLNDQKTKRQ